MARSRQRGNGRRYRLVVDDEAKRHALAQPERLKRQFAEKINLLLQDPYRPGTKQLAGKEWSLGGMPARRVRSGRYRILYRVDKKAREVLVFAIGERRDVYGGH